MCVFLYLCRFYANVDVLLIPNTSPHQPKDSHTLTHNAPRQTPLPPVQSTLTCLRCDIEPVCFDSFKLLNLNFNVLKHSPDSAQKLWKLPPSNFRTWAKPKVKSVYSVQYVVCVMCAPAWAPLTMCVYVCICFLLFLSSLLISEVFPPTSFSAVSSACG